MEHRLLRRISIASVFCGMRALGMSEARALMLSRGSGRLIHPYIYRRG
ncbi:MAG: hypothetical protein HS130_05530 [Deltaproteobacteria bacterium]|nr:hypothetical protein [Deltaproteobacteria bacterium]